MTYHWDVVGYFIWDLFEMSWRPTDGTSSLRPLETSSRHINKTSWWPTTETSWRRSTETLLGVSFETYLRSRWDVKWDVITTLSPQRLVAGWVRLKSLLRCLRRGIQEKLYCNQQQSFRNENYKNSTTLSTYLHTCGASNQQLRNEMLIWVGK